MSVNEFETALAKIGVGTRDGRGLALDGKLTLPAVVSVLDAQGHRVGKITEFNTAGRLLYVRGVMTHYGTAQALDSGLWRLNPEFGLGSESVKDDYTGVFWIMNGTLTGARLVTAKDWAWA